MFRCFEVNFRLHHLHCLHGSQWGTSSSLVNLHIDTHFWKFDKEQMIFQYRYFIEYLLDIMMSIRFYVSFKKDRFHLNVHGLWLFWCSPFCCVHGVGRTRYMGSFENLLETQSISLVIAAITTRKASESHDLYTMIIYDRIERVNII